MDVQSQIVAKRAAANRARQLADRLSGDYKIHALVAPLWRLKLGPRWAVRFKTQVAPASSRWSNFPSLLKA